MPAKKILIVDDNPSGGAILSLSLRLAGCSVSTAAGGAEALRILEDEKFDCLITDAMMSPMDGFELSLKAKAVQPKLRIMLLSALCPEKDLKSFPIEKFFPRPVSVEELLGQI